MTPFAFMWNKASHKVKKEGKNIYDSIKNRLGY